MTTLEAFITTEEAARETGYTCLYIRHLLRMGKLRGQKFARSWLVERASVREWRETHRGPRRNGGKGEADD